MELGRTPLVTAKPEMLCSFSSISPRVDYSAITPKYIIPGFGSARHERPATARAACSPPDKIAVTAGSEKEPGAPAAHPGPGKWKTKLNDAAPAAERKAGSLAGTDAKRRAIAPRKTRRSG
jgi:hypothetical protein